MLNFNNNFLMKDIIMLKINDVAPNFTLKNTAKENVSLSDYKNETVILAFYPGAYRDVYVTG